MTYIVWLIDEQTQSLFINIFKENCKIYHGTSYPQCFPLHVCESNVGLLWSCPERIARGWVAWTLALVHWIAFTCLQARVSMCEYAQSPAVTLTGGRHPSKQCLYTSNRANLRGLSTASSLDCAKLSSNWNGLSHLHKGDLRIIWILSSYCQTLVYRSNWYTQQATGYPFYTGNVTGIIFQETDHIFSSRYQILECNSDLGALT